MSEFPAFARLEQAISYIAQTLEVDRPNNLALACVAETRPTTAVLPSQLEPRLQAIAALAKQRANQDLRDLYVNSEFPPDSSTFKLGGHQSELGHIHIDFKRTGAIWVLYDIWMCR